MRKNSSSSLFLMELILAILFFSLASTVCIKLFVQSHLLSKTSVNLNNAILWCQNLAEGYNGLDGDLSLLSTVFPEIQHTDNDTYTIYFDEDWQPLNSDSEMAVYCASINKISSAPLTACHIYCLDKKSQEVIYEINTEKYVFREVSTP